MGYTLQAIVGKAETLIPAIGDLPYVNLPQDTVLVPLTSDVRSASGPIPWLPFTDDGLDVAPESLIALCKMLSARGPIAYLEAEFHGGEGVQAMLVATAGNVVVGPIVSADAINVALR